MEHTKGPWKTEGTLIWAPDAKAVIAQVSELRATDTVGFTTPSISSPDFHEIVANAKLVAQAPAMEALLTELIDETLSADVIRILQPWFNRVDTVLEAAKGN
jgi:hypothetical protein